jgi:hypothetical protein
VSDVRPSDSARSVTAWLRRCGGRSPHEALSIEFIDRRGYDPDALKSAIGELEVLGTVRWVDPGTLELSDW